ncbi:MAG: cation:proton antiporter, partial [Bacteroidetes bacterium]|nr:cation:proton antiporter [Bacteroidota bacterium]
SGLALNKLIPHTSALMNRIEFIGNSLFIPFFLISVGMIVDTKVIFDGPDTLFVAAVLSITAISGKWIAAFLTQISFGFKSNERQLIFGLSSAHAAATLAVILVGYKAGILDEKILNGTIILILITCVVASFVTERASKRIVVDSSSDESFTPEIDPIENILIPVDSIDYLEKQIELSVLIKEKRSHNPITILNVVPNDDEAETNIAKGKSSVNEKIQLASLNKINVNLIARIDHNKTSGIIRTSKEIASNILILNWFVDGALMDKIFGEKMDMLLDQSDKMILVLKIDKPLVSVKRIVIAAPPLSELENGFKLWVKKITKLSEELSVPVILFSNEKTFKSLDKTLKSNNISIKVVHHEFNDWEDFLILSRDIYESDMFVLVSARKNSVSYISYLDTLPVKLDKHFNNNLIVVYPQQFNSSHSNEYENSNSEPLKKSIDVIEKVGKGIGSIFKK